MVVIVVVLRFNNREFVGIILTIVRMQRIYSYSLSLQLLYDYLAGFSYLPWYMYSQQG